MAELIAHTCQTYLDLSELEHTMRAAHMSAFSARKAALASLQKMEKILENSLARRQNVYTSMVNVWEQSRLPKGFSTPTKKYFYKMDRSRHFANRTSDMSHLIYDEQLLDIEGYLEKLGKYRKSFQLEF
ncbi:MAG: hypothetical protein IPL46_03585 [Saprospiraceae bacterium]|nr:hypothetical protein [Saprospiraceae bacterium]